MVQLVPRPDLWPFQPLTQRILSFRSVHHRLVSLLDHCRVNPYPGFPSLAGMSNPQSQIWSIEKKPPQTITIYVMGMHVFCLFVFDSNTGIIHDIYHGVVISLERWLYYSHLRWLVLLCPVGNEITPATTDIQVNSAKRFCYTIVSRIPKYLILWPHLTKSEARL